MGQTNMDDDNNNNSKNGSWEELMGKDLMMKRSGVVVSSNVQNNNNNTNKNNEDVPSVQIQDAVIVDIIGRYAESNNETKDIANGPIFHIENDLLVIIGEKDVIPGLELGIRFMSLHETVGIWCHSKYAYGPGQRKSNVKASSSSSSSYILPSYSNVYYVVTVKEIITGTQLEESTFKVRVCESKKYIANDIYSNEIVPVMNATTTTNPLMTTATTIETITYAKGRALTLYKRSAEMLEYMLQQQQQVQQQAQQQNETFDINFDTKQAHEIFIDCLNNTVVLYMKCNDYHKAKEAAVIVLTHDPDNTKALIRAAKASLLDPASSYDEVQGAIQAAVDSINSNDNNDTTEDNEKLRKEVTKLQNELKRNQQQYKQRNKEMSNNIAKKFGTANHVTKSNNNNKATEETRGEALKSKQQETKTTSTTTTATAVPKQSVKEQQFNQFESEGLKKTAAEALLQSFLSSESVGQTVQSLLKNTINQYPIVSIIAGGIVALNIIVTIVMFIYFRTATILASSSAATTTTTISGVPDTAEEL